MDPDGLPKLTERERDCPRLVCVTDNQKEIARHLAAPPAPADLWERPMLVADPLVKGMEWTGFIPVPDRAGKCAGR